jgi:hypothetical protein
MATGYQYTHGVDLQPNHQTDAYSCAITVCDLMSELSLGILPWVPKERKLQRIGYTLFLCISAKICSSQDLGMSDESLHAIKAGVLAPNRRGNLLSPTRAMTDILTSSLFSPLPVQEERCVVVSEHGTMNIGLWTCDMLL